MKKKVIGFFFFFFVSFVSFVSYTADGSCRLGRNLFPPERTCIIYLSTMAWRDLVRFQKDDGAIIWPKSSSSSSYSCPVVWATTGNNNNNFPSLNQNNRPIITKNNPPSESYKNYYAVSRRAECYSIWFKFSAKNRECRPSVWIALHPQIIISIFQSKRKVEVTKKSPKIRFLRCVLHLWNLLDLSIIVYTVRVYSIQTYIIVGCSTDIVEWVWRAVFVDLLPHLNTTTATRACQFK